jgi:propionyl-CoA carboxylase alpha chain
MPSIGTLSTYKTPSGEGIRVDDGFEEGMTVPMFYDPMISKLITYGKTREEAIQLMIDAINGYKVQGVATTLSFGKFVCEHKAFTSGNFDTHFVENHYSPKALNAKYVEEEHIAALVGLQLYLEDKDKIKVPKATAANWKQNRS